jgi:hypothetical protein
MNEWLAESQGEKHGLDLLVNVEPRKTNEPTEQVKLS